MFKALKSIPFKAFVLFCMPISFCVLKAQNISEFPSSEPSKLSKTNSSAYYFSAMGERICYRKWGNPAADICPRTLLLLHGIGFHSYPYRKIMNYIQNDSIVVYAMDLPGHGLSGNRRGVIESNEKILDDINSMIYVIEKDYPGSHKYLMGVSMGGIYAVAYAVHDSIVPHLSGLILTGAALKVQRSQIFRLDNLFYISHWLFNRKVPVINLDGKRLESSTTDQNYINTRRKDSLSVHRVSIDYLLKVHEMQRECRSKSLLAGNTFRC
jgi:alpha-beta hydrolase superfamily lysophospholipase